jgi:hypothetical protein
MLARKVVGRAQRIASTVDADGYTRPEGWGAPQPVAVYGWQPVSSDMPFGAEISFRVITSLLLLVPDTSLWHPGDRVWLHGTPDGDEFAPSHPNCFYLVTEDVRDMSNGPFGFRPGGAVVIEKVTG